MSDQVDIVIVTHSAPLGSTGQALVDLTESDGRARFVDARALAQSGNKIDAPALMLLQGGLNLSVQQQLLRETEERWPDTDIFLFDAAPEALRSFFEEGGRGLLSDTLLVPKVWQAFVNGVIASHRGRVVKSEVVRSFRDYEMDQAQGYETQRQLMPIEPLTTRYCKLSHRVKPCLTLSGDFIDYQALDADRTLFCVVDVSGHGASSALVTAVVQAYLRGVVAVAVEQGLTLRASDLMQGLNQVLCAGAYDHHATCVLGIIDGARGLLHYVSAGHFPYPMVIQNGEITRLESSNLPLGLLNSSGYDAHQLTLVPDFRLVIVTDGVLEGLGDKTLVEREAQLLSFVERDTGDALGWLGRLFGGSDEGLTDDASVLGIGGVRQP